MGEKLEKISLYLATVLVFLLPWFFLPILTDWFDLPKQTLLAIGTLIILSLWLVKTAVAGKMPVVRSAFLFPAALLAVVSLISAVLSPNRAFSLLLDPVTFTGSVLLFFTLTQLVKREGALNLVTSGLLLSAGLLSFMAIFQTLASFVPSLSSVTQTFPYLSVAFSPTGSALSQAIFLSLTLPVALGYYLTHKREDTVSAGLNFLLVVAISLGLLASVFFLYRNQPILLPAETGWKIATNSVGQSLSQAFFGVGPGNFLDAFTVGRGLEFNTSKYWNLRFTTSSNFYFYLLTTIGIAGLAAFLLVAAKVIKVAKTRLQSGVANPLEKGLLASLVLALILFALLPAPPLALITFFILLGLLTSYYFLGQNSTFAKETELSFENSWLRSTSPLVALALLAATFFYLGKATLADYYFAKSLSAARSNKGTDTYNFQIKAISVAPTNDSYHVSYSQTNLALADALAGQPNLSDEQKQTVVALVQQAIRESRLAAGLAPKRAANFENLSSIYRALVNFAQGADQWAIASQQQAITLDPVNPRLRLDLGGIYFSQKNYQAAGQAFAAAITLKPDYANAHYNLAQAMKLLGLKDQAVQQLQLTASLVCPADQKGADCERVNAEISGLTPPAATTTATPSATLATPSAQPTNLPKAQTKPPAKIASPTGELAQ